MVVKKQEENTNGYIKSLAESRGRVFHPVVGCENQNFIREIKGLNCVNVIRKIAKQKNVKQLDVKKKNKTKKYLFCSTKKTK